MLLQLMALEGVLHESFDEGRLARNHAAIDKVIDTLNGRLVQARGDSCGCNGHVCVFLLPIEYVLSVCQA